MCVCVYIYIYIYMRCRDPPGAGDPPRDGTTRLLIAHNVSIQWF